MFEQYHPQLCQRSDGRRRRVSARLGVFACSPRDVPCTVSGWLVGGCGCSRCEGPCGKRHTSLADAEHERSNHTARRGAADGRRRVSVRRRPRARTAPCRRARMRTRTQPKTMELHKPRECMHGMGAYRCVIVQESTLGDTAQPYFKHGLGPGWLPRLCATVRRGCCTAVV